MGRSKHPSSASPGRSNPRSASRKRKKGYLSGKRILPKPITGRQKLSTVIDETFLAYNSARLREGCELMVTKMLRKNVTLGMSLSGALTPAGLGCSSLVPLVRAGFVDWIVSTGANLYHDLHFALNCKLFRGTHKVNDADLRRCDVVRIYDVLLDHDTLLTTDAWIRRVLSGQEFQKTMSSSELHYLLGKAAATQEKRNKLPNVSLLAAAYRCGVPIYTSSPGDSSIGMDVAELNLGGGELQVDPSLDVNETTAIVLWTKRSRRASALLIVGGGSPKNFMLQTEPQLQDILGIKEAGHDYFFQITDARADTGGLSGASPSEAVSWGKLDPKRLPDAVVCHTDATIALPLLTHYVLANCPKRKHMRLYERRGEMLESLRKEYRARGK